MGTTNARLLRLFIISYAPLAAILAIQQSEVVWPPRDALAFWVFALLARAGLIDAYRLPRGALRKGHQRTKIDDVTDQGGQIAAYFSTYLLPFLGFDLGGWRGAASLSIYFIVLLAVFLRSDLALVNPSLYLTGWRVTSGSRDGKRVLILIPNGETLEPGDVNVIEFGSFLVYDGKATP